MGEGLWVIDISDAGATVGCVVAVWLGWARWEVVVVVSRGEGRVVC